MKKSTWKTSVRLKILRISVLSLVQGAKSMPNPTASTPNSSGSGQPLRKEIDKDLCAWFVLKTMWRQEEKAEERLTEAGVEVYIPRKQILREDRRGKKQRVMVPAINSLVFVKSSIRQLEIIKEDIRVRHGQILYFYTNHEGGRNVITAIPESQMDQFRSACDVAGDTVQYFLPEELDLAKGTRVRIHGGPFEGHEGLLLKIKGKRSKSLIISIEGFLSAAFAEVSPEFIEVVR